MNKLVSRYLSIFLVFLSLSAVSNEPEVLAIDSFLTLGPIPTPLPVLNTGVRNVVELSDILVYDHISLSDMLPESGKEITWQHGKKYTWKEARTADHRLQLSPLDDTPGIYYAATYLKTNRWLTAELKVEGCHLFSVYLNGTIIASKTTSEQPDEESHKCSAGSITRSITLKNGKHTLIIKNLNDPDNSAPWSISVSLHLKHPYTLENISVSLSPQRFITIANVLDDPRVGSVHITPDGEYAAVELSTPVGTSPDRETWTKVFRTRDGSLYRTFRGGLNINNFAWAPDGRRFSYVQRRDGKATLWVVHLDTGEKYAVLKDIERFGSYEWSPTGTFIVFSITERDAGQESFMRRITKPVERWPWWIQRSFLHLVHIPSGVRQRLTAGELSTPLNSISPDGRKLLFSRTIHDFTKRPYTFTQLFVLDLESMSLDTIHTGPWSASAQWSPDSRRILITAGPSFFGSIGINLPENTIPNEYDTQAYIYDTVTGEVDAITRYFDPAISSAHWSQVEHAIYFNTTDRSYSTVYRYDLRSKRFEKVDLGVEIVNHFDIAKTRPVAVYTGESSTDPPRFYLIDLNRKRVTMLHDPNKEVYEHIIRGKVEEWTFTNELGVEIDGMVYYPPDFNPAKKYPLIVYYYGGVTPVSRAFEGRYPRNKWAAQGYVVYVPQPSGAIGYGQQFSALHVNDWGKIVADEIIQGTKEFLEAHDFIDRNRVAAIGASYGGFMTMLLLTRTDIFTAAVAHAGISSIASYWGVGYWGYSYSAVASAYSFPWNRRDIYVDQSPLFNADKITTPLLLITGDSDTNVPPGESTQMFVALKMLGREVEYIEVEGQDHHILDYEKRIKWGDTIIAWFDKHLKNQPEWWQAMYGQN